MITSDIENRISKDKNILVVLEKNKQDSPELQYTIENFCGNVVNSLSEIERPLDNKKIYVCGDLNELKNETNTLYVIKELSVNYENAKENIYITDLGKVPILISNSGVYFRDLFGKDYFNKIKSEHIFQHLTESNKDSLALRKGIYLTEVSKEECSDENEILHYRLLRCSSNFTGPTDNFRVTDHIIINELNDAAKYSFEDETKVNHVLVQIYENKLKTAENTKEVKSKIKAHSDKTKDMPKGGIIVFCTFYDEANFDQLKPSKKDKYDWCYKETSGLTKLHFKLKKTVTNPSLEKEFSITLYPNSAFLIPLSTNRLYTHEIRPSVLNVDKIPVRMGYVARCSNLEAVHMNGQTYIKENGELIKLEEMTAETMVDLKNSYYKENMYENKVEYGKIHFSMNSGDYKKPII